MRMSQTNKVIELVFDNIMVHLLKAYSIDIKNNNYKIHVAVGQICTIYEF